MLLQRRMRGWRVGVLAAVLPTLQACYEYAPLATPAPPVGQLVMLQVNDQGRVGLADRFGTGVAEIEARLQSEQANEFVVTVYRVMQVDGQSTQWSGETVHLNRAYVGTVRGRQLSKGRTALLVAGGAAVLGLLIANRDLIGGFSGPTGDPQTGEPPAQSTRIPIAPAARVVP